MQAVAYQRRISGRPPVRRAGTRRARALYPSLAAFYNAERRRLTSRELDVGLWWRDGSEGPAWRAAWVQETGELYILRLGAPEEGGGEVEVLGVFPDRQRLDGALAGWREHCGEPGSLGWLRGRARTPVQVSLPAA